MSLSNKIEEIRRKPEKEKLKYVWGMVAICMFFIICVWIISVKNLMKGGNTGTGGGNVFNSLESISEESQTNQEGQVNNAPVTGSQTNPYYDQYDAEQKSSTPVTGFSGE